MKTVTHKGVVLTLKQSEKAQDLLQAEFDSIQAERMADSRHTRAEVDNTYTCRLSAILDLQTALRRLSY